MAARSIVVAIAVPLVAIALQQVLFAGVAVPPQDHGSGSMFDLIADRYDLINRVLALGMDMSWRQRMVEEIRDSLTTTTGTSPPRLLDVSTGTADVALLLARGIPESTVVGVDPSPHMLQRGREKLVQRGLDGVVQLQTMDARDLSALPSQSFHAATMAFGIRNVPGLDGRKQALCEIHRVLVPPHSVFCILEFSEPSAEFGILGRVARVFIRHVIPFVGGLLSGAPREYWHLQNSIRDFPDPPTFVQQINDVQCATGTLRVQNVTHLNFGSVQLYTIAAQPHEKNDNDEEMNDNGEDKGDAEAGAS